MKYNVKFVSQINIILFLLFAIIYYLIVFNLFTPLDGLKDETKAISITITEFVILYFLWQKFVTGRTEWTIDDSCISINWIKKFPLLDNKNLILKWEEVENITDRSDPNYHTLRITLIDGQVIKFYHDNLTTRDNYGDLTLALYERLKLKHRN